MGIPTGSYGNSYSVPIGIHEDSHRVLLESSWGFPQDSHRIPVGIPTGIPTGILWEWELKFNSHGNPGGRGSVPPRPKCYVDLGWHATLV